MSLKKNLLGTTGSFYQKGIQIVIIIENLVKEFKLSKKQKAHKKTTLNTMRAVDDISLRIKDNEIFALLGPNGAGKTTCLRCISTLINPSSGSIRVAGFDTVKKSKKVKEKIAFLTSELKLDEHFTPDYITDFFASLHNIDKDTMEMNKKELFDLFGISEFKHTKIKNLSTGMKQKLSIAVSLIHDPDIIIFDEPTNGLDVLTAKAVIDYLLELKRKGKTIILSTHMLHIAEKLCDRLAIIFNGRIMVQGTLDEILEQSSAESLEEAFFNFYKRELGGF